MILLWLSLLVLFLDRVTKLAVVSKMTEGESIPVFENIFHLTYVLNPGAAFGMLPHNRLGLCSNARQGKAAAGERYVCAAGEAAPG